MTNIGNDWDKLLSDEAEKPYMRQLHDFLENEYRSFEIYPKKREIFNALSHTPYSDVKVVILGQDPYHEPNQAHGLSFSVKNGAPLPPSLENIYKEIHSCFGNPIPTSGDLTRLANQGVLLLNTVLTVRRGAAGSHRGHGWEQFTDFIISILNSREKPIVFMLWGADARKKKLLITNDRHLVLEAPHPSPLSAYRGFFGCKHFLTANQALVKWGEAIIEW